MQYAMHASGERQDKCTRPPPVRVIGIYQDLSAGLKISRLCARLSEEFKRKVQFEINIYSFEVLMLPAVAAKAAEHAEEADAVIISGHRPATLPTRIRKWIEKLHLCRRSALVELFDGFDDDSPARRLLHELAHCAHIPLESLAEEATRQRSDIADEYAFISVEAVDEEELSETLHYGIND
jgi:hypothetical protein